MIVTREGAGFLKNYKILLLAAFGGVLLLFLIMLVLFLVFRHFQKRAQTSTPANYNMFYSAKDEFGEPEKVSKSELDVKDL